MLRWPRRRSNLKQVWVQKTLQYGLLYSAFVITIHYKTSEPFAKVLLHFPDLLKYEPCIISLNIYVAKYNKYIDNIFKSLPEDLPGDCWCNDIHKWTVNSSQKLTYQQSSMEKTLQLCKCIAWYQIRKAECITEDESMSWIFEHTCIKLTDIEHGLQFTS